MSLEAPSGPSTDMSSSVASVIAQMRAMQSQATALPATSELRALDQSAVQNVERTGFGELLSNALSSVNEIQQESAALSRGFVAGEHQDLVGASIASQKSSLAFQAVVTARNRMVAAYQDIMNMPI